MSKKRLIGSILVFGLMVASLFGIFINSVEAANGNWTSAWSWDLNGVSGVGTSNISNPNSFTLIVQRGNNTEIGRATVTLGRSSSANRSFWGAPFTDRRGRVLVSAGTLHLPWFNE